MQATKHTMPETMYRASRCCRILGNPMAYLIMRSLGTTRKTPGQLSQELQVPLSTISMTLRHLRNVDLVRYETEGMHKWYWVKSEEFLLVLDALEKWVEVTHTQQE